MSSDLQILTIVVVLVVVLVNVLVTGRRWRRVPQLRRIPALDRLTWMRSESIEANRPIHFSSGGAGIGDAGTMLALVSNEMLYYVTRSVTAGDAAPLFTTSNTTALPLFMSTMQHAYATRQRRVSDAIVDVRWYPAGVRSLSFAAGTGVLQGEENVAANVLAGQFGSEIIYILDAAKRRDRPSIAVSDHLIGQAIAYALTEAPLIGEEIFAAAAYMGDDSLLRQRNIALDLLRWTVVFILFLLLTLNIISHLQGGV